MTSPIEALRAGIMAGDWQAVCDGFRGLTGVWLEPPSPVLDDSPAWKLLEEIRDRIVEAVDTQGSEKPMPWPEEDDEPTALACMPEDRGDPREPDGVVGDVEPSPPRNNRVDMNKFRVQHNQPEGENGRACRVVPHEKPNQKVWRGKAGSFYGLSDADLRKDSRAAAGASAAKDYRNPVKKVEVQCSRCPKKELVHPALAPKSVGEGDVSTYVCGECIRRPRRGG